MSFTEYAEAKEYSEKENLPLWDTHQMPDRYYVGHLSVEMEEDENNDWEEIL